MIEVGEYIRTKDGQIGIFQNIDEHCRHYGERLEDTIYIINTEKNEYLRLIDSNITKHSKNIIDLIEVGDIVNGCRVGAICCGEKEGVKYTINFKLEEETYDFQLKIETILTHEQYEQNCYKVGED